MAPIPSKANEWSEAEKGEAKVFVATRKAPKVSPKKLIAGTLIFLITLNLLNKPLSHCYRRVNGHLCRPRTLEGRVHKILSSTPLIGKPAALVLSCSSALNRRLIYHQQIPILTYQC